MADRSAINKTAPSRKKLLLIPVLGSVLLYVIIFSSDDGTPSTGLARTPVPQQTNPPAPLTAVTNPVAVAVTWPTTPLADVMAVNPFKMPAQLKPPVDPVVVESPPLLDPAADRTKLAAAKADELREALKGQRLKALVQTSKGVGAIVGDAVVAVGDLVGERLRVSAIRPEGVVLELIDKPVPAARESDK